jgi:Putative zinc-finger
MTNYFDEFDERNTTESNGTEIQDVSCQSNELPLTGCSAMQRDRFELLSAYLDGEVTATERRQVEAWLDTDVNTQRLYTRLLMLRQGLQMLPIAKSEQSVDQLVDRVTARIERQPRRLVWGGLAIAAMFVGALFGSLPREVYAPSIADSTSAPSEEVPSDGLMIAINHPPIEIPKAAISTPFDAIHQSTPAAIR